MRICSLLLLLAAHISFGQNDSVPNIPPAKLVVKLAPLSLVPVYINPCVKAGVEYRFNNPMALYGEVGSFIYSAKGFTSKLEFKYYLRESIYRARECNYISAELYYKREAYDTYDTITPDPVDGEVGFPKTEYSVFKQVQCFTVKYGVMQVYRRGFVLDFYAGLGIRFKQATNTLSAEDNANMPATSDYGPNLFINKAGNFIYPNFDAGVKIGWRIK